MTAADAEQPRRIGDRLGMVARRGGQDAPGPLLGVEGREQVDPAPDLEGAGRVEVLALEVRPTTQRRVQGRAFERRRGAEVGGDRLLARKTSARVGGDQFIGSLCSCATPERVAEELPCRPASIGKGGTADRPAHTHNGTDTAIAHAIQTTPSRRPSRSIHDFSGRQRPDRPSSSQMAATVKPHGAENAAIWMPQHPAS